MRRRIAALVAAALMGMVTGVVTTSTSARAAQAADTTVETQIVGAINALRAENGLPVLGVHPVLVSKAEGWSATMAGAGRIWHSTLTDGISVPWTKLGENVGYASNPTAMEAAFEASPPHRANMLDPSFQWIGIGVTWSGNLMYVAEEFMTGAAPPASAAPAVNFAAIASALQSDTRGRSVAVRPQGGYWTLSATGVVTAYGGAPDLGSPDFGWNIARGIAAMPDGNGYLVVDGWGGVHEYGSAAQGAMGATVLPTYWRGWDIVRGIAITPDGRGYATLDGWGGLHTAGTAQVPSGLPYWSGWDIARSFEYAGSNQAGYLLDGWGSVHPGGGARFYGQSYWPGWDIARGVAVTLSGYAELDGFGGIHPFGGAPVPQSAKLPYLQLDMWRGIAATANGYVAVRDDGLAVSL